MYKITCILFNYMDRRLKIGSINKTPTTESFCPTHPLKKKES